VRHWRRATSAVTKLERRLGGGGMGEVWAAFDLTLKTAGSAKDSARTPAGFIRRGAAGTRSARLWRSSLIRTRSESSTTGVTEDGLWYYGHGAFARGKTCAKLVRAGKVQYRWGRLIAIARQVLRASRRSARPRVSFTETSSPTTCSFAELGGESDIAKLLDFGIAKSDRQRRGDTHRHRLVPGHPRHTCRRK